MKAGIWFNFNQFVSDPIPKKICVNYTGKNRDAERGCPMVDEGRTGAFPFGRFMDNAAELGVNCGVVKGAGL